MSILVILLSMFLSSPKGLLAFKTEVNDDRGDIGVMIKEGRKHDPLIVSCVGDSLTNGSSVNVSSSYPAFLQRHFDKNHFIIRKFGSNGASVLRNSDKPFWMEKEYDLAMGSHPHYVIVQFGTNDAKPQNWNETKFKSDYVNLIERFQSLNTRPKVIICIPPPIYCPKEGDKNVEPNDCGKYASRAIIVNNHLPTIISEIAYFTGAVIVDNFNILGGNKLSQPGAFYEPGKLSEKEWTNSHPYDGIHPNAIGYDMMADNIAWKMIEMIHRNTKLQKLYALDSHPIIQNDRPNPLKHDSVYEQIYNHMKIDPQKNITNIPIRPVIACVGVSIPNATIDHLLTVYYYSYLEEKCYFFYLEGYHYCSVTIIVIAVIAVIVVTIVCFCNVPLPPLSGSVGAICYSSLRSFRALYAPSPEYCSPSSNLLHPHFTLHLPFFSLFPSL